MSEALVVGNKPYQTFTMNSILDTFGQVFRCNMSMPNKNNGTKYGHLGLCNHIYDVLVIKKISDKDFIAKYAHAYKEEEMKSFLDKRKNNKTKYENVFFANPKTGNYNSYFSNNKSSLKFSKEPRTGYRIMFDSILTGDKVFITNFSVMDEARKTYYVKDGFHESECHSKEEELEIVKWLHRAGRVDASLCLLEDVEHPTFNCSTLMPTKVVVDKVMKFYDSCTLKNCTMDEATKNIFSTYALGIEDGNVYIKKHE